jgi:hypothetical protein
VLGGVDGEQDAERPPAQRQRGERAAGELARDLGAQRLEAFARQLRADREPNVDGLGKLLGAGQAQQLHAFEIDQVQRDRCDAREPPGLGDDLVAEQVRRHLAQYNVLAGLNLPRIPVGEGSLTTGGLIALAAFVIGTLLAALAGGKAGTHFHRKVDRVGLA